LDFIAKSTNQKSPKSKKSPIKDQKYNLTQRTQSTGFRQNVQKWNYTDLQNYQMVGLHSKVGFSIIL